MAANQLSSALSKPFSLMEVKNNPKCNVSLKEKKHLCKLGLGGAYKTFILWR